MWEPEEKEGAKPSALAGQVKGEVIKNVSFPVEPCETPPIEELIKVLAINIPSKTKKRTSEDSGRTPFNPFSLEPIDFLEKPSNKGKGPAVPMEMEDEGPEKLEEVTAETVLKKPREAKGKGGRE